MLHKKTYHLVLFALLSGCEALPSFEHCPSPKFIEGAMATMDEYFLTEDVIAKFCPAKTPKVFSYHVTPEVVLSVYLKEEWIYLKANDSLQTATIYAPNIRVAEFKDYTHVLPVNALKDNQLNVTINDTIEYRADFTIINCTCVSGYLKDAFF